MRRVFTFSLALGLSLLSACDGTGQESAPTPSPPGSPETTTAFTATTTTTVPSGTAGAGAATTTTTLPQLQSLAYEEIARIEFPIQLVPFDDDFDLLATKGGRLFLLGQEGISESPVLDLGAQVRNSGEQGLLSVAVSDDTTRVFVHYSANDGDTVVSGFDWDGTALVDEQVVLRLDQPAGNHNGGMLQFASDGALYLGLGDGGGANDAYGNGQNTGTLLGGLVRIDVNAPEPAAELYQYGLRNPWRFWIDRVEGDRIYIADVGQNSYEEVSVAALESGTNYGWPLTEGLHCFRPSSGCDTTGVTLPLVEVQHGDSGTCSITGGIVYRGSAIPEITGHYFYSDYCGGYLRSFRYEDGVAVDETDWTDQVGTAGSVASFGLDRNGEMYVLTTDRVLEVVATR